MKIYYRTSKLCINQAKDRTDVIDDGYGGDEADDIFSDLFNWFG